MNVIFSCPFMSDELFLVRCLQWWSLWCWVLTLVLFFKIVLDIFWYTIKLLEISWFFWACFKLARASLEQSLFYGWFNMPSKVILFWWFCLMPHVIWDLSIVSGWEHGMSFGNGLIYHFPENFPELWETCSHTCVE